jgi:hypothetical protein
MGRSCNTNGEKRIAYMILVGKPEGGNYVDQDVGWWIILKWVFES